MVSMIGSAIVAAEFWEAADQVHTRNYSAKRQAVSEIGAKGELSCVFLERWKVCPSMDLDDREWTVKTNQASSTKIFFAARSRLVMRKLRTCPARAGSVVETADPLFQRACSIELNEDRSPLFCFAGSLLAVAAALTLQIA